MIPWVLLILWISGHGKQQITTHLLTCMPLGRKKCFPKASCCTKYGSVYVPNQCQQKAAENNPVFMNGGERGAVVMAIIFRDSAILRDCTERENLRSRAAFRF
ncbi:hypothetical protein FQA47_020412 [Oryzias melastigma]|uniref:Secreted protein n=1 Tax=Oryzias melastigma TaxID=30732 RepID=A0A834KXB6_ORYME|nr:hypothetical protein FQA47_020412 [Oryzias melastigma]